MSYKTTIKVVNDPKFYPNGVVFATEQEANQHGEYKLATWTMSEDYRVMESFEKPNYTFTRDGLQPIPE